MMVRTVRPGPEVLLISRRFNLPQGMCLMDNPPLAYGHAAPHPSAGDRPYGTAGTWQYGTLVPLFGAGNVADSLSALCAMSSRLNDIRFKNLRNFKVLKRSRDGEVGDGEDVPEPVLDLTGVAGLKEEWTERHGSLKSGGATPPTAPRTARGRERISSS